MKRIVRYHIRDEGILWVQMSDGQHRRATVSEEISILRLVPDLAGLIGWQGSPMTGSQYV